eukprot:CAMPEP_0175484754 /NCGR_PEP_ID=MMETSP0095-20121207/80160_1 /TAXON_ID=311494 /ORGANISM="Alexandrium monilatum, Strain CCMP3105" /LENGTH=92 /DNA_ID=CAMNT_0016786491 /DNA_START=130 /DNA_END=405 /DNA_ORIENTATION=+
MTSSPRGHPHMRGRRRLQAADSAAAVALAVGATAAPGLPVAVHAVQRDNVAGPGVAQPHLREAALAGLPHLSHMPQDESLQSTGSCALHCSV